jgi:hypothetical protein
MWLSFVQIALRNYYLEIILNAQQEFILWIKATHSSAMKQLLLLCGVWFLSLLSRVNHFGSTNMARTSSGVNFTNILQAAFSYESFLRTFYVLTIWVCNFLAKGFGHKSCS